MQCKTPGILYSSGWELYKMHLHHTNLEEAYVPCTISPCRSVFVLFQFRHRMAYADTNIITNKGTDPTKIEGDVSE